MNKTKTSLHQDTKTNKMLLIVSKSTDNKKILLEFDKCLIEFTCDLFNYVYINPCLHSKLIFRDSDTGRLIHEQNLFYTNMLEINLENSVLTIYRCEIDTYQFSDTSGYLGLIGHRGSGSDSKYNKREYKENTLASFNNALSKVDWIEFDVQISHDIPVVYHDLYIKESGQPVKNKESIKSFKEDDHQPPILDYVLKNILEKNKKGLNIEIKNQVDCLSDIPNLVDRILNVIYKNDYKRIIFSSFHPFVLLYLKMRIPHARILLIFSKDNEYFTLEDAVDLCLRNDLSGMVFEYGILDDKTLEILEYSKKDVYVYDVVSQEEYDFCKKKNIKGIITDEIDLLK